jgi:hypothetical protein
VFSKDASLAGFLDEIRNLGTDDAMKSYAMYATYLLVEMYRAEKWVTALHDTLYAQRFLQKCCTLAADMVLLLNGEIPTRESVLRAAELNPALMDAVYVRPSTTAMTETDIRRTLKALDGFMAESMDAWAEPILKFLAGGDARRVSECAKHFGVEDISVTLAWLASRGVIERVSLPSRVFKHIRLTVEEVAYLYIPQTLK